MKSLATLLSLSLASSCWAAGAAEEEPGQPIVIFGTRPKAPPPKVKALKRTRAAGLAAAGGGIGLMGWSIAAASAGPIGWAAGLLSAGGMSAYLAQRRLDGREDFKAPSAMAGPSASAATAAAAESGDDERFETPLLRHRGRE
jgi:hypothetical protein